MDGDIKEALLTRSEQFLTFLNAMQSFKNNRQIIYDAVKCSKLLGRLCQNIRKFIKNMKVELDFYFTAQINYSLTELQLKELV